MPHTLADELISIQRALADEVNALRFALPVHTVYNPLVYAREPAEIYIRRYAQAAQTCRALFLGMNPGPFGMAQTGAPFGEITHVREWLGIEGKVLRPPAEHPKRPVLGFACAKSEVSGRRLWGFFRERFGTPEAFFKTFYVSNYCPLVFMEAGGRNLTPDKLPKEEREALFAACDRALQKTAALLRPEIIIGVGAFAAKRAAAALTIPAASIPHPSPASPKANRGWSALAENALKELGVL